MIPVGTLVCDITAYTKAQQAGWWCLSAYLVLDTYIAILGAFIEMAKCAKPSPTITYLPSSTIRRGVYISKGCPDGITSYIEELATKRVRPSQVELSSKSSSARRRRMAKRQDMRAD